MTARLKVLISHYHEERALAEAWKELLKITSLGAIEVWYSSDSHAAGGMTIGSEWRDDLYTKIAESNFILAIQTPMSAGRPWIMWECGIASGIDKARGIIPVIYSMEARDLANPISSYQLYEGESENKVREVCERLIRAAGLEPHIHSEPLNTYLNTVKLYRPRKAIHPEQMDIWRDRFEKFIQSGRVNEVFAMRQQMYASLGNSFEPVDPSVHELLSKILLDQGNFQAAIEEVNYALKLLDGDTVLLHRKALALAEVHNLMDAEDVINEIISLNGELRFNPEIASLQGRIYREKWKLSENMQDLDGAIEAYHRAYQADKTQYYPGINAATLSLIKGDIEFATQIFQEIATLCKQLQQQQVVSYWVDFTVGEACLGLGEVEAAIVEYNKGLTRMPPPSPRDLESAKKGVRRIVSARKLPNEIITCIEAILKL
jgi:tetratricopeptide (TPR) repeat protein